MRPSSFDVLLGRRWVSLVVWAFTMFTLYRCSQLDRPALWAAPILGLFLFQRVLAARKRVQTAAAWQGQWNAMAGEPGDEAQPLPSAPTSGQRHIVVKLLLAVLWALCGVWLCGPAAQQQPLYPRILLVFVGLSIWGFAAGLRMLGRRLTPPTHSAPAARAEKATDGEAIVQVSSQVPWRSPSLRSFTSSLPAYARALLRRSAAPSPANDNSADAE